MKVQTTALVNAFTLDGQPLEFPDSIKIDLEFSAIDTGGSFRDPILDFSLLLHDTGFDMHNWNKKSRAELLLVDPHHKENRATLNAACEVSVNGDQLQINGRLKDDHLTDSIIGFVLRRFR
ncbi:MAG TPA: hypothetical protein VJ964_09315 [Balneolaceae bacterium]|nr:hypothetical protein [Balneolaceae bacterium]